MCLFKWDSGSTHWVREAAYCASEAAAASKRDGLCATCTSSQRRARCAVYCCPYCCWLNVRRRSFALPEDAREEGVNAKLVNGVLTVDV